MTTLDDSVRSNSSYDDAAKMPSSSQLLTLTRNRQILIRRLQDCATAYDHCATVAVEMSDDTRRARSRCRDAASACRLATALLARQSELELDALQLARSASALAARECELHLEAVFGECVRRAHRLEQALQRGDDGDPPTPYTAHR